MQHIWRAACDICAKKFEAESESELRKIICELSFDDPHLDRSWIEKYVCKSCAKRCNDWLAEQGHLK